MSADEGDIFWKLEDLSERLERQELANRILRRKVDDHERRVRTLERVHGIRDQEGPEDQLGYLTEEGDDE